MSSEVRMRRRAISTARMKLHTTDNEKCTTLAATKARQSKLTGGGKIVLPRRMAAARRTSRKKIAGNTSQNAHHNTNCTTVAITPAAMPAYTALRLSIAMRISISGQRQARGRRVQQPRHPLRALPHYLIVIPLEQRPSERREYVHPPASAAHTPFITHAGRAAVVGETPAADALHFAAGAALQQGERHDARHAHVEGEPVGDAAAPRESSQAAYSVLVARFDLLHLFYPPPPARPAAALGHGIAHRRERRCDLPGGDEVEFRHSVLTHRKDFQV